MEHNAFRIGDRFWTATGEWQCTDVGTRTIVAVKIDPNVIADPSWLNGPPYALAEHAFDEYDLEVCYPTAAERDAEA
jgi:hypothetical protein